MGSWVTAGKVEQIASDRARLEVLAGLVTVCLERSNQDPVSTTTLASQMEARPHQRDSMLMDTGWATMPGPERLGGPRLHAGTGGAVLT